MLHVYLYWIDIGLIESLESVLEEFKEGSNYRFKRYTYFTEGPTGYHVLIILLILLPQVLL